MIIYISGKYSGEVEKNVRKARQAAIRIWELGAVALCPHLNTAFFERDCDCDYEDYIRGDLELLEKCDVIYMLDNWQGSDGAHREHRKAKELGLPIFYSLRDLKNYVKTR